MKKLRIVIAMMAGVAMAALGASAELTPQQARVELMARADTAIARSEWSRAEVLLLEAIDKAPDDPSNVLLLSNLGIVRFNAGKDSLAIDALNRAHNIAPASVVVLSNRARINAAIGDISGAYRDFSRVIELDSTLIEPYFYRGMIAMGIGDMMTAATDFDRLNELAPDSTDTHLALASFYQAMGEPEEAIKEYTTLIEKAPSSVYYCERASLYLSQGELTAASEDIAAGLALDPDDPELYLQRAALAKMRYRLQESEADVRRAIELGASPDRVKRMGL